MSFHRMLVTQVRVRVSSFFPKTLSDVKILEEGTKIHLKPCVLSLPRVRAAHTAGHLLLQAKVSGSLKDS